MAMSSTDGYLPVGASDAALVGRAWVDVGVQGPGAGPALITTDGSHVFLVTTDSPFCSDLMDCADRIARVKRSRAGAPICTVEELFRNSLERSGTPPFLLSPIDLQAVKAAGVTFASSLIERLVEERTAGQPQDADRIRSQMVELIGGDLSNLRPGSPQAEKLSAYLKEAGAWSQYLEVGLGPFAEIFTKGQPLSTVGFGMEAGLHPQSEWNNPEPEVVLIVTPGQEIVGVTLGNDVNLRDFEGLSALLLGRAKDNNASCALGPFIRLIDENYTLDDIRGLTLKLVVRGDDGFTLEGVSRMSEISRDIEDLVKHCAGTTHQYPDGFALMTGTLFAPTADRSQPGMGFTHVAGDMVEISSQRIGALVNRMNWCDKVPPWTLGIRDLITNFRRRGLI